jgi:Putative MetA-pathway of phenol degradation
MPNLKRSQCHLMFILCCISVLLQVALAEDSIVSLKNDGVTQISSDVTPIQMDPPPIHFANENYPLTSPAPVEPKNTGKTLQKKPPITPVGTSRPSFTDAVTTVPQGSLQFENGATFTDNRHGTYSWTTPETLIRLGMTANTELRYTVPNFIYIGNKQPGHLASNFGDTSVGLSHHWLLPGKVDFAVIPILNLPTGANLVSSNGVDPQARLVAGKGVTQKLYLSSMFDTRWYTNKHAPAHVVMTPTLIGYYTLAKNLTGFLEYAAIIPTEGRASHYAQTGALYLISPRNQVDVRVAAGLNPAAPNFLVGFGYSFRVDGLFGASRDYSSFRRKNIN